MYILNKNMSYKEKNEIYAIYIDHTLIFLKDAAAKYFGDILKENYKGVSQKYIDYLCCKNILVKIR